MIEITEVRPGATKEARETMSSITATLLKIEADQRTECRLCGERFSGSVPEILEKLGEHGEKEHSM